MKNTNYVLAFVMSTVIATLTFGQGSPALDVIDLLNGEIQGNGLPKSWLATADNSDCSVKFVNGAIHFERMSPNEKCSFAYKQNLDNGDYLLKTKFEIDVNEPEIFLDGKPLEEQNEIKVTAGVLNIGIQTSGAGKVWGSISRMTCREFQNPSAAKADFRKAIELDPSDESNCLWLNIAHSASLSRLQLSRNSAG